MFSLRNVAWSWVKSMVVVLLLLWPAASLADTAKITLKSGEVTEAEVVKLDFGKQVTIRLEDGSEKTIPWSEIEDLQMQEADSEVEPADAEEPAAEPTPPVEPAAAAPPVDSESDRNANFQRVQILDKEIDDAKDDRPGLGGPITLMAIGYPAAAFFIINGVIVSNVCYANCGAASIPSFAVGGLSAVAAIAGTMVRLRTRSRGAGSEWGYPPADPVHQQE